MLREIEVYSDGKSNGHWKSFHEDGKPKLELFYSNDEVYKKVEYDRFGNPVVIDTGEAPEEDPKEAKRKAKEEERKKKKEAKAKKEKEE